ncbi:MAG TPA: UDP-N-acetylmuramoyl-tripeptide--D-alanyl-D-alanine ligase [Caulobacteraceae bacterium]|jgi:UDP-N-acetylmuramoyl-tripeptide--D-alanyl-D-alanine ligase
MAEPLWTSEEILAAVGGELHGRPFAASGVTFDSREVEPGDLFVALKGERDGHDFAPMAFERGAAGALTSRCVPGSHVQVADTLPALEALGAAARERCPARRAAVTGSVGKTSVTQAVKAGLELAGRAHGSVKSYNNHIGVPLTLARMPRDTERAVFEIGMNHPGEIAPLSRMVRPHVAAITTVGAVHTEFFEDGERGVMREKAEVFAGLEPGGAAVLNADSPWFSDLRALAETAGARVLSFGSAEDCDAHLLSFQTSGSPNEGAGVRAVIGGEEIEFALLQTGVHWGLTSLCVLLVLHELDVSLETGVRALSGFAPLQGRGLITIVNAPAGAFTLIDDSYNANPVSMRAAIATLAQRQPSGRRVAVVTDMLELGPSAQSDHARLSNALDDSGIDLVFAAGPLMAHLHEALPPSRRGGYAPSAAELAPLVTASVQAGDVVLVKGSNGSRARDIAAALRGLDAPEGEG